MVGLSIRMYNMEQQVFLFIPFRLAARLLQLIMPQYVFSKVSKQVQQLNN